MELHDHVVDDTVWTWSAHPMNTYITSASHFPIGPLSLPSISMVSTLTRLLALRSTGIIGLLGLLLAPLSSHAQIADVGSEATLDVATWNIEWFGHASNGPSNDAQQVRNVADIVLGSGIDIWAVQEIADVDRAQELDAMLPAHWEGILATVSSQQRVGFLWDNRVLQLRQSGHILESFNYEFAGRPPLSAEFDVTLPDTSFVATFIVVHMKAFSDQTSWERRTEAARQIKNHIDTTDLATQAVFFLGDFNDELTASTFLQVRSPYAPFIEDPDHYQVLTLPLEQSGGFSYQSGSFLDHIIVSDEVGAIWVEGSSRVLTNLVSVADFYSSTSDHLPVMASFGPITSTDLEHPPVLPASASLSAPWPNPAQDAVSVRYEGRDPGARVQLVDVLGRVVSEQAVQQGDNRIDLTFHRAGLYLIRIVSRGDGIASRWVVKSGS